MLHQRRPPSSQAAARLQSEVSTERPGLTPRVDVMSLDLASFHSTRAFVDAFKERNLPLHVLVNNAGVAWPQQLSQ